MLRSVIMGHVNLRRASLVPVPLVLVLVTSALGGCGLLGGGSDLDDEDDLDRYIETMAEAPSSTELSQYVGPMQDAAFSDLDVRWQVQGFAPDEPVWTAWKLDDDIDLGDVGDDLVDAGYEEDEVDGLRHFTIEVAAADPTDQTFDGRYPIALRDVTLVPDEQLVVATPDADEVAGVIEGDDDTVADDDALDSVVGAVSDVEFASLQRGDETCALSAVRLTPQVLEALRGAGLAELGAPEAKGLFLAGDDAAVSSVLSFADADEAGADAEARATYLRDGSSLVTAQPYSELGDFEVAQDGELVTVEADYDGGPRTAVNAAQAGDDPGICGPKD